MEVTVAAPQGFWDFEKFCSCRLPVIPQFKQICRDDIKLADLCGYSDADSLFIQPFRLNTISVMPSLTSSSWDRMK